jgi:hypothetical protein
MQQPKKIYAKSGIMSTMFKNRIQSNENLKKYTCPGCGIKSCSLDCVKIHKETMNCTGTRNKTKYVPRSQYGINHLQSGILLLMRFPIFRRNWFTSRLSATKTPISQRKQNIFGKTSEKAYH